MVSTCANPNCATEFRKLCDGRLFVIDPREPRNKDHATSDRLHWYWLCGLCAERFTLRFRADGQVSCILHSDANQVA
jgi:hypothetical protein